MRHENTPDVLSNVRIIVIGAGAGLLGVTSFDATVDGPVTNLTKRHDLNAQANDIENNLALYLPAERTEAQVHATELRDSAPKELFPYDAGFEIGVGIATGMLAVAAVRSLARSRRRVIMRTRAGY